MRTLNWMLVILLGVATAVNAAPLRVCATTPDLGDLVRQVGGDEVSVTVFAKGAEDPHFIEAKPGFITQLSRADLYIETGLELEVGWAPVLLKNARNARVLPGATGYLDASKAITPMEIPQGPVDRSMGDVHPGGNPHYLLDPHSGWAVANLVADRLAELRPEKATYFQQRRQDFADRLEKGMKEWEAVLAPWRGAKVVADHNLWPYFADHYGLQVVAFLEPKPGMAPTTRHLGEVVAKMKAEQIKVVLSSPYFDARHAAFVQKETGAHLAALAHQVGSRPGTDTYLDLMAYNVKEIANALRATRP